VLQQGGDVDTLPVLYITTYYLLTGLKHYNN